MSFDKVTIIGLGFIGASFALAIRKANLCDTIYGYSRSLKTLQWAKSKEIIDEFSLDIEQICSDSDLIILSTPVGAFLNLVQKIRRFVKPGAIITDVGSIKGKLVYDIESTLPNNVYYVGSHPIAGGEKSGAENAKPDLFKNALCIITPTESTDQQSLNRIKQVWESVGCRVKMMNPYEHDKIYALISHLPHLVAYAVVNTVNDVGGDFINYAGQGFKDTTRIALSPPEIWRDIIAFNRDNLLEILTVLRNNLNKMESLLKEGDFIGLEKEFHRSKSLRERLK